MGVSAAEPGLLPSAGRAWAATGIVLATGLSADIATAAGRADEEVTRAATLLGRDGTSPDSLLDLADHLVDAVKVTGTEVTFRKARHHVLSPAVAADALRIIQEGLTNSMKHAPGAPISVTLEETSTGLNVEITNEPARSAPLELDGYGGAGLLGMTERVKAHGGQAERRARAGRRLAGSRQPALDNCSQRPGGEPKPALTCRHTAEAQVGRASVACK